MDFELLKYLGTLGVGGVLAGFIFWFYRKDTADHAKAWQGQSEMLVQVVKDNTVAVTSLQQTTSSLHTTLSAIQNDMREREHWWRAQMSDRE